MTITFSVRNSFPGCKGSSSHISSVTMRLYRVFSGRLGGAPTCEGTRRALSVLAVASGIVCNGGAKTAPSNETSNCPFTPNTGPVRKHSTVKTLTSLGSITGLPCRGYLSNVSGAFAVAPSTLNGGPSTRVRGLMQLVSKCFTRETRRLGMGILGHRLLVSTCRRPRGCPGLAVHISNCTIRFAHLAQSGRLRIVSEAFRRDIWW